MLICNSTVLSYEYGCPANQPAQWALAGFMMMFMLMMWSLGDIRMPGMLSLGLAHIITSPQQK